MYSAGAWSNVVRGTVKMCVEAFSKTILIAEDDELVRKVMRRYLEYDSFIVREVDAGNALLEMVESQPPDLIVLNLLLPDLDEMPVMERLKREHPNIPVVLVTTPNEMGNRILGLDLEVDEWASNLFYFRDFVDKVHAVLRRVNTALTQLRLTRVLEFDDLCLDPVSHSVTVKGEPISLTAREFDLLWFLAAHPSQVFTRDQLLDHVWGYEFHVDPSTVTVHIHHLREKIEMDPAQPRYITTVWGVGYRFERPDHEPAHDLRLTLASLERMIDALAGGAINDTETVRRYLQQSQIEIARMRGLVDEFTGQFQFDPARKL